MISWRARLAWSRVQVLTVGSLLHRVIIPKETSLAKFRDEEVDDILEGARLDGVGLDNY